ncbi:hypothetical protein MPEAHAMD_6131 [Methylobacterium frigidaeris]|uniref:HTH lysR-type domain-containing protein n=2 Tax=Methylobacterium frigidaeris TaxID=2038277 RepID=A0AA37M7H2_9HYPH|nr:hypothetical protein MPEAHAMD_6131 [Methylobacterium frigidaeris]
MQPSRNKTDGARMAGEISDLRLFVAIVAAGNLSAAARALSTSPAVMSRHLTALENRLGVRLVTRTSRRFELTDEGALFHERCVGILAEIDDAEAEAAQGAGQPRGSLRISAPLQWDRRVLAPIIAEFSGRFPRVSPHLVLTDTNLDVVSGGLDIVIGAVPPQASELIVRKVLSGTMCSRAQSTATDCPNSARRRHRADRCGLGRPRRSPTPPSPR